MPVSAVLRIHSTSAINISIVFTHSFYTATIGNNKTDHLLVVFRLTRFLSGAAEAEDLTLHIFAGGQTLSE